ncbi:hypothetical protein BDR04DRAFT_1206457 [Suillus decipiens]|nr:hypothetical protein BDR04DRAFT_1206457 [Suillus decipiens]
MDVIKEAIFNSMWEVKEINQWKRFSKRTIATLQKEHRVTQSGLKLWLDLAEKKISRESAQTIQTYHQDKEALSSTMTTWWKSSDWCLINYFSCTCLDDPNTTQHLMDNEVKQVMKEAKQVMHQKSCKKLSGIMTTICSVFKKEAQHVVPHCYSLNLETGDMRSLTNYRKDTVALLLINYTYLFKDPTIMSPVNHPGVIEMIYNALWNTHLHEALSFNDLNDLDDLFLIGSIAVHNSLLEFQEGIYKVYQTGYGCSRVGFACKLISATITTTR